MKQKIDAVKSAVISYQHSDDDTSVRRNNCTVPINKLLYDDKVTTKCCVSY